ncbi:MAG TPA: fatty acid hydroxylase [Verrucomicrobiales bacterium]|nr:fatty acid hydroxylase [Verrucomicrobiales bacterium]
MQSFLIWFFSSFAAAAVFASFFEWALHRFVMHRAVGNFTYAFRAHTHIHHKVFKADHSYHLSDEKDKATIPMAWWNGPVLVCICTVPFIACSFIFGSWAIALGALAGFAAYYGAYEYMHWCMHLPKARRIERSWLFRRLNGHHLLHHRYMQKNFNVVFPLADLCLGTLMLRSKCHFAQPTGPAVPNVQPKLKKATT